MTARTLPFLAVAALLLVGVAACGPDDDDPDAAPDEVPAETGAGFPLDTVADTLGAETDGVAAADGPESSGADTDGGGAAAGPSGGESAGAPTGGGAPRRAGGAPPAGTERDPASTGPVTVEGRVVMSGAVPTTFPALAREGGSLVLTGDLADELGRLSGATVRVRGRLEGQGPGEVIRVAWYEILGIDGQRPRVGVLVRAEDGLSLRTDDGEELSIRGAPANLVQRVGAKVWIVGEEADGSLRLQSYGVIRAAEG